MEIEILKARYEERASLVKEVYDEYGLALDATDILAVLARKWFDFVQRHYRANPEQWQNPKVARQIATFFLAREALVSSQELYESLRIGLVRPASWLFRKLYETQVNILFLRFEESGNSAYKYHHWEIYERGELKSEGDGARQDQASSLEDLGDSEDDRKVRGKWAQVQKGRRKKKSELSGFMDRADYVYKELRREHPFNKWSDKEWALWREALHIEYNKSNTVIHPSVLAIENIMPPLFSIKISTFLMFTSLDAYRKVIEELSQEGAIVEKQKELWLMVEEAFDVLTMCIIEQIVQKEQ